MAGAVTVDPIPLLTPYKMGKFNLSHRYVCICTFTHTTLLTIPLNFKFSMSS